jgi:hypothetical protein
MIIFEKLRPSHRICTCCSKEKAVVEIGVGEKQSLSVSAFCLECLGVLADTATVYVRELKDPFYCNVRIILQEK